ncbi:GtrA family protein [Hufsiella ginkgonis]|uniref:GtrA family protein n=1 Tax=Hufsiella ginkgonis TaxID=2695274 RepID=A0A7K1XVT5_9SPHI|nr:GtrA family protein [Hufsiella ginkgonis]MXV15103.1 GtrA family protein [Hufsiella ginkgonis]
MRKQHEYTRRTALRIIDFFYPLFRKVMPLQTFRYAACGSFNVALDNTLYFILYNFVLVKRNLVLPFFTLSPHIAALFISMSVCTPIGFYLSRYVVFQETAKQMRQQFIMYMTVVLCCILINYAFLKLFVDQWGWYPTPSRMFITIFVVIFSYLTQRFITFKPGIKN